MKYVKGLDTIRAFAVLIVIFRHWYPTYPLRSIKGIIQHIIIPTGGFGVVLFFVLSGYLITTILLMAKSNNHNKLHVIKNFVIRRSLRIFPIYYLLIAVLVFISYPFEAGHLKYLLTYTFNYLVIKEGHFNNFSHAWSLSVEEQFYLIWPWLILFVRDRYLKYVFYGAILFALVSIVLSFKILHMNMVVVFTPNCFDAFGIGGLYAYSYYDNAVFIKFQKYFKLIAACALIMYFGFKICPYFDITPKFGYYNRTIESVISIWLIDLVINNKSQWVIDNILENKILNGIGKISYGLYLYHYPFPYIFSKYVVKKFPDFELFIHKYGFLYNPIMLIIVFIIAFASFEFIEKRITNFKGRFEY